MPRHHLHINSILSYTKPACYHYLTVGICNKLEILLAKIAEDIIFGLKTEYISKYLHLKRFPGGHVLAGSAIIIMLFS